MKTTLDLPDDLVREMKLRAVLQGRTLRDLAADLLRQGLGLAAQVGPSAAPSLRVQTAANGLPVIRCRSDAPASSLSPEQLLALEQATLQDEDAQRAGLSV